MKQVKVLTIDEIELLATLLSKHVEDLPVYDVSEELEVLQSVLEQALVIKIEYSQSPFFSK